MKIRTITAAITMFLGTDQELQKKLLTMRKALWKTFKEKFRVSSELKR